MMEPHTLETRIVALEKNLETLTVSDRQQSKYIRRIRLVMTLCVVALSMAGLLQMKELSASDRETLNKQIATLISTALVGCAGVMIAEGNRESKS